MRHPILIPSKYSPIAFSIFLLVLATLGCGGFGLAYEKNLTGSYAVWATDTNSQAAIVKKDEDPNSSSATTVIDSMIFAYGWNKKFIIAKQHPDPEDPSITNWFILEISTDTVHGPLSESAFNALRQQLQIPATLSFSETIEP
jgi:hypothetical protein